MADKMAKIEKLIEKGKWDKIEAKYLKGSDEERLDLAKACATSDTDGAFNCLITLLNDKNDTVQLAAINSVGATGNDHATAQLQWLLQRLPPEKKETIDAIHAAIANVKNPE